MEEVPERKDKIVIHNHMIINPPHQQSTEASIYNSQTGAVANHQHQISHIPATPATYFQPHISQSLVTYNSSNYCLIARQDLDVKPDLTLHIRGHISEQKASDSGTVSNEALHKSHLIDHAGVCT